MTGYERTKHRARACNRYPKDCDQAIAHNVSIALGKMLSPFYKMGQKYSRAIPEDLWYRLNDIVYEAGMLSRQMRRCGDVVYHWPPTFKDGMYQQSGNNDAAMIVNQKFPKHCANT